MAKSDIIIQLMSDLTELDSKQVCCSEGDKRRVSKQAKDLVWASDLPESEREEVFLSIGKGANPTGWHYACSGIGAGVAVLKGILAKEAVPNATRPQGGARQGLSLVNLRNLVSDGSIFSVDFVKRSTGELRHMVCRVGVRRHLKGGGSAYRSAEHNLLPVFDMQNHGYRSIPVESILRISVHGQVFDFSSVDQASSVLITA